MSDNIPGDKGYRIIRLVNGEKLIAKICGSTKHKLILHRPMTIRGMVTKNSREWLILNDWLEHCRDNEVGIKLDAILTISNPDEFISEAYDCQKEYMDTGHADPQMDDLPSDSEGDATLADLLAEMDGGSSNHNLKDWVENFVSSILENAAKNLEEEWDEDEVDTDRPDWGNQYDDWSPYPEDYTD